jgi:hypothetical protein
LNEYVSLDKKKYKMEEYVHRTQMPPFTAKKTTPER